ncbi:hypothetical protein QRD43_06780 [Pelomonas sp. APW6]|uniref:Uncharacterized protein n=1 Tax=Roseateles subflavus TaxID=3053353 RepID=A0ABT7LFI9_9BURK|nr:hypothetical protein [Pelomonas sp. APW6]MDL5031610.1 hypothetical protein [Pelomonas sp. APW6]
MIEIPKLSKPAGEDKAPRWFHVAVAMSMVLSAGAALVSALKTSATMQALVDQNARLVRAGSTPILQFYTGNVSPEGKARLRIWVENVGTGPARIVSLKLRLKDQVLDDVRELPALAAQAPGEAVLAGQGFPFIRSTIEGHVLAAGHQRSMFEATREHMREGENLQLYGRLDERLHQVQAEACYCSVFDECWVTDFGPQLPKAVARCDVPKRDAGKT